MSDLGIALFSDIWDGISSIPFFDFGFNFDKFILGSFIVSISILIFKSLFNPDATMSSRIGLDVRQNRNVNSEYEKGKRLKR